MRQRIMAIVRAQPGIHKSALCRELDMGWGAVGHHVDILLKVSILYAERKGRQLRLFPASAQATPVVRVATDPFDLEILRVLHEEPGSRLTDISRRTDRSIKQTKNRVMQLVDGGMVERQEAPHPRYKLKRKVRIDLKSLLKDRHGFDD